MEGKMSGHDEDTEFEGCGTLLLMMGIFWLGMIYCFFTMLGVSK